VISSAPPDDLLLVMGDSLMQELDVEKSSWLGVRGMFGVGKLNENGEHLLSFCVMNELCVTDEHNVCKEEDPSVYLATSRNQGVALY